MAKEENGVWRTIGGRRVFIKEGQSLSDAMKESGKFNTNKVEKEVKKIKVDPNDKEAIDRIADNYENLDNYEGLDDIAKDYILNRRKELARKEFTDKANEIHDKSLQKAIESEKTTDYDKRYNTRDVKDYQDENGMWHINDTAKNEIENEVRAMKDKELDEAYHELEKDDQSFEARTIRAYYAMRKDKTQDSDETSEESFTMTNGNREVTVTKDDNGKWVDSDGNKYMGYLSKSEVKSYFKGNWKETKSALESAEKSKVENAIDSQGKAITFNRNDETFKYDGAYPDSTMKFANQSSKQIENLGTHIINELKKGNMTYDEAYDALQYGVGGVKGIDAGQGFYHINDNINMKDILYGTAAQKKLENQMNYYIKELNKFKSNDWVRDAFNKYKKEHPNSKITFETFKKSNIK